MLTFEIFVVIVQETVLTSLASLMAIFTVVLIITGSLEMAGLIMLSVSLVYLFLVALIPTTDIDFNHIVVVHLIASLGLSVLYSA